MSSGKERVRLDLAYDGTDFAGWQVQPGQRTVQGVLEQALAHMFKSEVLVKAAGRTDAGVHAAQQVAVVDTASRMSPEQMLRGANALLPDDLRVVEVAPVADDWDPRQASYRAYRYRLRTGPVQDPLRRRFVYHLYQQLDVRAMSRAAEYLKGYHDFAAFRSSQCGAESTEREMFISTITRREDEIHYDLVGWAFLRHMVRIVVGTLLEVGQGRRAPESLARLLTSGQRAEAGPTAPAHGLILRAIGYDPEAVPREV